MRSYPVLAFVLLIFTTINSIGQNTPAKIDVAPVNSQNRLGADVPVKVQLQDAYGQPAAAEQSTSATVKVEQPTGSIATYAVTFAPGETLKQIAVPIAQAGVAKLSVEQKDKNLIGASSFVLVRPNKAVQQEAPTSNGKKKAAKPSSGPGPGAWLQRIPFHRGPKLVLASFTVEQGPAPPTTSGSAPSLMLTVSGEDASGGIRADGVTCAVVQVFYLGADDPKRDIQIWLSPSNGKLDNNPIIIPKGSAAGKACWTSEYPIAAATISVAATNPPNYTFASGIGVSDPKRLTEKFTDDIRKLDFVNVPSSLTIVDNFSLTARFEGRNGPIQVSDSRDVHFSADSAVLNLNPAKATVQPGGFDSSTVLIPIAFGTSTVQASTPSYTTQCVITITYVGVLLTSLLGGLIGGLLSWVNSDGKVWARVFTGLAVGLVGSWAYVMVGLPKIETAIVHNRVSVFFVALIMGFGGVKALSGIASKLKLASF